MTRSRFIRIGGMAGLVLALMMIVAFALDMAIIITTGRPPLLDPQKISLDLVRAQGVPFWPLETWLYTLMIIPGSVLAIATYRVLHSEHEDSMIAFGLLATILFWIFHTMHNVLILAVFQALVPHYSGGSLGATTMEVVAAMIMTIASVTFDFGSGVGSLFLAGSLGASGLATLRTAEFPRWTGYVALAASLAMLGAYLKFMFQGIFFLGLLGWVLFIIWVIGAALAILRSANQTQKAT